MNAVSIEEKSTALKGRMVSMSVLVLYSADLDEIDGVLYEKATKAPGFFDSAPLLVDIENLEKDLDITWLDRLLASIAERGFVFVGIAGARDHQLSSVRTAGIAVWPSGGSPRNKSAQENNSSQDVSAEFVKPDLAHGDAEQDVDEKTEKENPAAPTMVLETTVRSGQRVYAKGGDLIVLSSVNTGAEIMADGHIHVYGTLRGKALAGVTGNEDARIFCHNLQADLIAIAGYYLTNEDLPADKRGNAVQISLSQESLNIEML